MIRNNQKYTLLLADDHVVLRDGLANMINETEMFAVCARADNGKKVLKAFEDGCRPDLVMLDLNMPEMDGYTTAEWIAKHYPEVKMLILTMFDSEIAMIRLLQLGVRGFLKKDISQEDLKGALVAVAEGGYFYSHSTTGRLVNFFKKSSYSDLSVDKKILTALEIEMLKLSCTEMTYKEIAGELNLSPRAIENHREVLFEKLDIKSRVGLALYAVRNGIVSF
jgi:DNA-binding NarL/FixJ family response regulator